jgi:DNA-directed RNA polymerase specialized sigma24 family protein
VVQDAPVNTEPRDAVERVWREQGAKLWRSLVAFTGDPEVATDAMAEAFAQALGRGDAVREHDRWIWRSSFRIAAGELKARGQRPGREDESVYVMPEPIADLVRALGTLSPNQRAAAILHDYADPDEPRGEDPRLQSGNRPRSSRARAEASASTPGGCR